MFLAFLHIQEDFFGLQSQIPKQYFKFVSGRTSSVSAAKFQENVTISLSRTYDI
jgi:hypothetical protein